MSKYRAILIDPEKQTFTELKISRDIEQILQLLHCQRFPKEVGPLNGSLAEGFDKLYVSNDHLEGRDDRRFWFQVDAERDPPSSFPIAGFGLVCGVDEAGDRCDLRISVAELKSRVTFTRRKFRGFVVKHPGILVDVVAPIIDDK